MSATDTRPAVDERRRFEGAWEAKRLGDAVRFFKGAGLPKSALVDGGTTPCVHYGQLFTEYGVEISQVRSRCHPEQKVRTATTGDVLMPTSDVTPTGLATASCLLVEQVAISGDTLAMRPQSAVLDGRFLALRIRLDRQSILGLVRGVTVFHIYASDLADLEIPVPTLGEQRAIAASLSDVDDLLQSLDRLIAKKRDVKQGAMQQLLTGTTRLPGFEGAWETKRLGELLSDCSSGATPSRAVPHFFQGDVPWVNSGDLNYTTIEETSERITNTAVSRTNLKIHPPGTFLIAITGLEASGTRGSCGTLGIHATTNQSCMALIPTKEVHSDFLFHWYVLNGDALAFQYCQGTKQQSYTAGIIKKIPILVPMDVDEQRAIAAALSDMDAEINALEARRDKVAAMKQGMMQELLTGRTRLPIPEEAIDA